MPIVTSQYWNQVHKVTPEDVMRDEEGLQTMRTLAEKYGVAFGMYRGGQEGRRSRAAL